MARPHVTYLDRHSLRHKPPSRAHKLIRPFLETCTDSRGPTSINIRLSHFASPRYPRWTSMITDDPMLAAFTRHAALGEEATGEHAEFARASRALFPEGIPFRVVESSVGKQIAGIEWEGESRVGRNRPWREPVPDAPTLDAFELLLERWEAADIPYQMFVDYTFLLVDEQRALLPYTDEDFEDYMWSFVQLVVDNVRTSSVSYNLKLPWSEPNGALSAFVARMREAMPKFDLAGLMLRTPGTDKARPFSL